MHKRTAPRDVQDRYPYFRVDLGDRVVVMRLPRAAQTAIANVAIVRTQEARLTEQLSLGQRLEISQSLHATMAALVGLCWADVEHDLDSAVPSKVDDLVAYGLAVIDELTESGLSATHVATLGLYCLAEVGRANAELVGAVEALGFIARRAAARSPSSNSPASNGGETPTQSAG
jgi:hypothetical protein